MSKTIDLTGHKFERLTVIRRTENMGGRVAWLCKCKCGEEVIVRGESLKSGNTKSCGCLHREKTKKLNASHRLRYHPLYKVWLGIKTRCFNPNCINYCNYGGRGISVCSEWKEDFKNFYDWCIENGYKEGLEIDRRDNDGDYCPENCRIVTRQQNSCNKRPNKRSSSAYKGVYWRKDIGKWAAGIRHNRKKVHLGSFADEIEAAFAYDAKAEELQGEYAWLNRGHFEEVEKRYYELLQL